MWPEATHSKTGTATLFGGRRKWRAAREIIDWSLPSQSIFTRKKPLQPATIRRIIEGLRKFNGPELEPFLVILRNNAGSQPIDEPLSTVTAGGGHHGLIEPVLVQLTHGGRTRAVDDPLPTVTTANRGEVGIAEPFIVQPAHGSSGGRGDRGRVTSVDVPLGTQPASNRFALAEPFLVPLYSERDGQTPRTHSVDEPVPVIPASGDGKFGVVEPFVLSQGGGGSPRAVSEPAPTIVTDGAVSLVQPFLVPPRGWSEGAVDSIEQPVRTIKAVDGHVFGLVEPFIVTQRNNNAPRTLDQPIPPLCTAQHVALAEPLIAKYNSTAKVAKPVSEPLDTVSTRDRFALVQPVVNGFTLDIKFRMLQPHELAAAMSFPKGYDFAGNKGDTIRQIGNAVDCRMAEALCGAILDAKKQKGKKEAVA